MRISARAIAMGYRRELLQSGLKVLLYVFSYVATATLLGMALRIALPEEAYLVMIVATGLAASLAANWLAMRIYEDRPLFDAGLWWNRTSGRNLVWGLAGGMGAAALVMAIPLAARLAYIKPLAGAATQADTVAFAALMLFAGAAGEEILFRGFGFQVLLRTLGPAATIFPAGVLFALLHANNPSASPLGLANTAGFGILFGYAFLRSRDIWLPIGLHFGWNFTLPLFGANVSGLKIEMTGYAMEWRAGTLWSGGAYGPEASLLASGVLAALGLFLWKAPIRRQHSPLLDPPVEAPPCDSGPQSSLPLR